MQKQLLDILKDMNVNNSLPHLPPRPSRNELTLPPAVTYNTSTSCTAPPIPVSSVSPAKRLRNSNSSMY